MKKIEFTTENVACVPNFQEAFILAPLMDLLIDNINYRRQLDVRNSIDRNKRDAYKWSDTKKYGRIDANINVEKIYNVLIQHGYCGTGDIDLLPDGYPLEAKD